MSRGWRSGSPAGRPRRLCASWGRLKKAAGRPAAPEEIASAISYLAGDEASFVHGAVLDVDGGRNAA